MRMLDAWKIIALGIQPKGYRVCFEEKDGCILRTDYFPERGEPLIDSEAYAWELAELFAKKTVGKCVNIYVVDDTWSPVKDYKGRAISNRGTHLKPLDYETAFTKD